MAAMWSLAELAVPARSGTKRPAAHRHSIRGQLVRCYSRQALGELVAKTITFTPNSNIVTPPRRLDCVFRLQAC